MAIAIRRAPRSRSRAFLSRLGFLCCHEFSATGFFPEAQKPERQGLLLHLHYPYWRAIITSTPSLLVLHRHTHHSPPRLDPLNLRVCEFYRVRRSRSPMATTPGFLTEYEVAREKLVARNRQKMASRAVQIANRRDPVLKAHVFQLLEILKIHTFHSIGFKLVQPALPTRWSFSASTLRRVPWWGTHFFFLPTLA